MTFSLILLTTLAQPTAEPAAPGGLAPAQAVAIIDGEGKLRITQVSFPCGYGAVPTTRDVTWAEKRGNDTVQVTAKVQVTSVILTTTELPANTVEAYTADGKAIAKEKIGELLAKEHIVLVATDGKKVDPFYLDLYKEGTIVLVPPANALGAGAGPYGAPSTAWPTPAPSDPVRPMPGETGKPGDKDAQPEE